MSRPGTTVRHRLTAGAVVLLAACGSGSGTTPGTTSPATAPLPTQPVPTGAATTSPATTTPVLLPVPDAPGLACSADPPRVIGVVPAELPELSGLVASRRVAGRFWSHNDSGAGPRLVALTADGTVEGMVDVTGVGALDWEDIAATADGRLVVADTGDNLAIRPSVSLHLVPEPLEASGRVAGVPVRVRLEDGPADIEAVAVDPLDATVWLVGKALDADGRAVLWRTDPLPGPDVADPPALTARVVARVPATRRSRTGPTAADISPDGSYFAFKNARGETFVFARPEPPATWAEALAGPTPCGVGTAPGEALAFSFDGDALVAAPEGVGAAIVTTLLVG